MALDGIIQGFDCKENGTCCPRIDAVRHPSRMAGTGLLAGRAALADPDLDARRIAVQRTRRLDEVDALLCQPRRVRAKHPTALRALAAQPPDTGAPPVRGVAQACLGRLPGQAGLPRLGHHDAVGHLLRGVRGAGVPGLRAPGADALGEADAELAFPHPLQDRHRFVLLERREVQALAVAGRPGRMACHHGVYATGGREAAHLVVGWQRGAKEPWVILSDEPTWPETLHEYGLRFHIEEGFLDQKSNGFQWESSKLRDRHALQRLCFVMAVATLALVCQGAAVAAEGKRRMVDPHWFRGHSYARIG